MVVENTMLERRQIEDCQSRRYRSGLSVAAKILSRAEVSFLNARVKLVTALVMTALVMKALVIR